MQSIVGEGVTNVQRTYHNEIREDNEVEDHYAFTIGDDEYQLVMTYAYGIPAFIRISTTDIEDVLTFDVYGGRLNLSGEMVEGE